MPQENMPFVFAELLKKLLVALSLDNGAAIQQRKLGSGDPNLRFYCFTNTESPELLQFFFPEMEGLTQLRITSPDSFDRDGGGCDLAPVYEALRKCFDAYWRECKEWVEGNLASSNAVQAYLRDVLKLPNSKEKLYEDYSGEVKYRRTPVKLKSLNNIFSNDPSVRRFMDAHGGGTVVLNDVTKARLGKDEIEAIVSISMIWLAQLGASDPRCTHFKQLLYGKIRDLFLADDSRMREVQDFREITSAAYHFMLPEYRDSSDIAVKDRSMVARLDMNSPMDYHEFAKNYTNDLSNYADVSSGNVKQKTLRYEEM